jgi:hypothetical protein
MIVACLSSHFCGSDALQRGLSLLLIQYFNLRIG